MSKRFFAALRHGNCKSIKASYSQKFSQLPAQCATALYNLGIAAILLANTEKTLKFHCLKSVQNLVSFLI